MNPKCQSWLVLSMVGILALMCITPFMPSEKIDASEYHTRAAIDPLSLNVSDELNKNSGLKGATDSIETNYSGSCDSGSCSSGFSEGTAFMDRGPVRRGARAFARAKPIRRLGAAIVRAKPLRRVFCRRC